jgi:S-sulfo-L-cysteine synthase (3-phospho-L-serine-dependent)
MNTPWFAFVESNTSGTGRLYARAAVDMGFRPILLTADSSRYTFAKENWIKVLQVNTFDEFSLIRACQSLDDDGGLAGITSSSDYFIEMAANLAKNFGLPGPVPDAIQACRDKGVQRLCLQNAVVGIPLFHQVDSVEAAVEAAKEIGFPVILKPIMESGSSGVRLCSNSEEVLLQATLLLEQRKNERGFPSPQRILVEEWIQGPEYSIETFNTKIVGITKKYLSAPPHFVEVGHDFPAPMLTLIEEQVIAKAVQSSLQSLKLEWGPAHTELRLTSDGPKIIEVNPRLAGGFIPELVRLASGVDLIAQTIRIAAGLELELEQTKNLHASIRFFLPKLAGTLKRVEGVSIANQIPTVVELQFYYNLGDQVFCRGDFRDRVGHVIACSDTATPAIHAAELANSLIKLAVEPNHR